MKDSRTFFNLHIHFPTYHHHINHSLITQRW